MDVPLIGKLVDLVSKGLTSIFDHKNQKIQAELKLRGVELEETQLKILKEVTEIEFQKFVLQNSLEIDKSFREFVTDYEGAAKDVHPYVQVLRAIIRPIITLWAVGLISYLMFSNPTTIASVAANMDKIPEKLWDIFFIVFAFWFGGRAVQHIIDKYTQGRVEEAKAIGNADAAIAAEQTQQEIVRTQGSVTEALPRTHHTEEEKDQAFKSRHRRGHLGKPFPGRR